MIICGSVSAFTLNTARAGRPAFLCTISRG